LSCRLGPVKDYGAHLFEKKKVKQSRYRSEEAQRVLGS